MRGVAALMVLLYHLFEAIAFSQNKPEQMLFHGFLAVDFFLILSGFVMGYAYNNEWDTMSYLKFFKKRLIRLHPGSDFGSGVWVSGVRRTRSNAVGLHISGWLGNSHFLPVIIITPPLTSGFRRERQHRDIPLRWSFMVSLFRVCRQHLIRFSSSQVFGK